MCYLPHPPPSFFSSFFSVVAVVTQGVWSPLLPHNSGHLFVRQCHGVCRLHGRVGGDIRFGNFEAEMQSGPRCLPLSWNVKVRTIMTLTRTILSVALGLWWGRAGSPTSFGGILFLFLCRRVFWGFILTSLSIHFYSFQFILFFYIFS